MRLLRILVTGLFCTLPLLAQAELTPDVNDLRIQWARIKYDTPPEQRGDAFATLAKQAEVVAQAHPDQAEALVWQAIILSSQAGEDGGLGALGLVKQARALLEQAEGIDPEALDGSVYTSLGSLYYQVPGWPIGFGDDDKAREYLEKALAVNPDGMDPNFFYAGYLAEQGDYKRALEVYQHALQAPPRPDRALADDGRRGEIRQQIALLQEKL